MLPVSVAAKPLIDREMKSKECPFLRESIRHKARLIFAEYSALVHLRPTKQVIHRGWAMANSIALSRESAVMADWEGGLRMAQTDRFAQ